MLCVCVVATSATSEFTTETPGELDILWHDSDALAVDGSEVGIRQDPDHEGLSSLMDRFQST